MNKKTWAKINRIATQKDNFENVFDILDAVSANVNLTDTKSLITVGMIGLFMGRRR